MTSGERRDERRESMGDTVFSGAYPRTLEGSRNGETKRLEKGYGEKDLAQLTEFCEGYRKFISGGT